MTARTLTISSAARGDLRNIYRFGRKRWGGQRASLYLEELKNQIWMLVSNAYTGKSRDDVLPGVRGFVVGQHVIFYRLVRDRIEIVRILHGRQDISGNFTAPDRN